jgi:hypothetical protein
MVSSASATTDAEVAKLTRQPDHDDLRGTSEIQAPFALGEMGKARSRW